MKGANMSSSFLSTSTSSDRKVATPTAFPNSGTFGVTQRVTLLSTTPGAIIHYTTDGSVPTASSSIFDRDKLPVLEAINDGDKGVTTIYTIKALAMTDGMETSDVATFTYIIERRSKDVYITKEIHPGIHMILDFDDTKMFLIIGTKRAMLIDAGLGTGNLRNHVEELIDKLPLDVIITHGHPDHIALMGQFQGSYNVYMNHLDLPLVETFIQQMGYTIDLNQIINLREGEIFDLGDRKFSVYEVPGHSAGSIVLFDEEHEILFSGDAVGSNRPTIVDSLWMQFPGMATIDVYLSTLQVFRSKVRGKIREIYGGHNDVPFYGEQYLDNLQQSAQMLVDNGKSILLPSLRPTDVWQVVVGDRLTDPNWAAINVSKDSCLTVPPEKIATLSNLQVSGAALDFGFTPFRFNYTVAVDAATTDIDITITTTSSRYYALTINSVPTKSGIAYSAHLEMGVNTFVVAVTSPDGSSTHSYTLIVTKAQGK
jgi:glyoxylase-like metal-dependent hydrolase (beta-lactamase superfamily II)